eukprot:scpid18260/ scgid10583/ 
MNRCLIFSAPTSLIAMPITSFSTASSAIPPRKLHFHCDYHLGYMMFEESRLLVAAPLNQQHIHTLSNNHHILLARPRYFGNVHGSYLSTGASFSPHCEDVNMMTKLRSFSLQHGQRHACLTVQHSSIHSALALSVAEFAHDR